MNKVLYASRGYITVGGERIADIDTTPGSFSWNEDNRIQIRSMKKRHLKKFRRKGFKHHWPIKFRKKVIYDSSREKFAYRGMGSFRLLPLKGNA